MLSGYSLMMEDPGESKAPTNSVIVGGTWRETIRVAYETTKLAFPGAEVLAHLDHKSFKSWQGSAITGFLAEQNIKIGKPRIQEFQELARKCHYRVLSRTEHKDRQTE
ncbi:D-aminoacyl-tRNA deacylase-like [Hibiscus syriacus]|uniref:D-aminoacyl-tRNA deacylase-like n=1 Tax=Hibiscus syriacus TaxID=106335 RepID=UPI001923A881|nr:D-aminoacyl-tRNA deacylase-like [Hibiscus syriacus]